MLCVNAKNGDIYTDTLGNKFGNKLIAGGIFVGALNKDGKDYFNK